MNLSKYFMSAAILVAQNSKDPNTQVGAAAVSEEDRRIYGTGYNCPPFGIPDSAVPAQKPQKYYYTIHAEINAILAAMASAPLNNPILYCTLFPCHECYKLAIQAGIKKIIYFAEVAGETWKGESRETTLKLQELSKVPIIQFTDADDAVYDLLQHLRGIHYNTYRSIR